MEKNRGGRPPLQPGKRQSFVMTIRMTPEVAQRVLRCPPSRLARQILEQNI